MTQYHGELRRGAEAGTVEGWLEDQFHWRIFIKGTRAADGSYALTAEVGPTPASMRIAAIDGEGE